MNADFVSNLLETVRAEERAACERRMRRLFGAANNDARWHRLFNYLRMVAASENITPYDLLWNLVQQHTRHDQEAAEDKGSGI